MISCGTVWETDDGGGMEGMGMYRVSSGRDIVVEAVVTGTLNCLSSLH